MAAMKNKVEPEICTFVDKGANSMTIEVILPGVIKDQIKLKVNSRCLILSAPAEKVEYEKYVHFYEPVKPEETIASCDHELLRIKIPLRK